MLIKRLSQEEQGRHYGYPDCCIKSFINQTNQNNITCRKKYYYCIYGFLPCFQCYEKLTNGLNIDNLMVNRKCVGLISNRTDPFNSSDSISQSHIFLIELNMLIKKTCQLTKLPYDNVKTWEQIQFLINPKRLKRKKVSEDRVMTYHNIRNIYRLLKCKTNK